MKRLAAVLAASLLSAAGFAQVKETIHVNIVEVPVTVVDRAGNPVRGLTEKNFELFDSGKKRAISSFDVVDFASPESVNAISPMNPVARRSFLLLFDLGFSSPNSLVRAQEAARRFVKEALQPRDIVAVATIDADRGCKLLTSFTTDRELIASAIDNPASFRGLDPLGISNQTAAFIPELEQPGMSNLPASFGPSRASEAAQREFEMAHSMASMDESAIRMRVERNVDALAVLAKILNSVTGHKQVVLLSEGLPAKYLVGRDARDWKAEVQQAETIIRGTWATFEAEAGAADQDKRFGSVSTQTLLERMTRYFRRSDVVLHAIDIQGVRVQSDTYEGARVNSNAGLAALARPTGGTVLENMNNVGGNFRRLMHQQEVVYILGFRAPDEKAGSFHELKVKVNGVAFGGRVEHRAGYFESGAPPSDRRLTEAEVIVNDIPQSGVRVAAFAAAFPTASGRAQVPVILEIDGNDLVEGTFLTAGTNIAIYAFDEHGIVRDRINQTLTFDRAKIGDRLRSGGMKYYGTLSLPPGSYAIKTLLRISSSERRGYARTDIRVPRPGEFGLVPFVIDERAADWLMVKGTSHAADAAYPFQINGEALVPAVLPRVHPGESRKIALFISNAGPDDLQLDMLPNGTIVSSAKSVDATKIVMEVPTIALGVNALEVVVRRLRGDALRARVPVIVQ